MSETATAPSRQQARRGSSFSDKQIWQAVRDEKMVRIHTSLGERITGWVYGVDDYHWGIVSSTGETSLVHKSAPLVDVTPTELSGLTEATQETVRAVAGGFRDYVMRTHFKQTSAATT